MNKENIIPWSMRFSLGYRSLICFLCIFSFLFPGEIYLLHPDVTLPDFLFTGVLGTSLSLGLLIHGTETVECLDNELILSRFLIRPKRIQWVRISDIKLAKRISASQYGIWTVNVFVLQCDDGKSFNIISDHHSKTDIAVFVSLLRDKAINADINLDVVET